MTYLNFLIFFLLPPICALSLGMAFFSHALRRPFIMATGALCFLAFIYTTPWDNYLLATDVWWYGEGRVIGTIGYVPLEEYAFFFLQTVLTSLWFYLVFGRIGYTPASLSTGKNKPILWSFALMEGLSIFALWFEPSRYLGLILAWALPVIFLQVWLGRKILLKNKSLLAATVLPPTIYLWFADAFAISQGIWSISPRYTLGIEVWGLPIEEALFFLVTNLMVGQGALLFVGARKEAADLFLSLASSRFAQRRGR